MSLRIDRESLLVATGLALVAVFLHAPLLSMVPGRDGGIFMYVGQGILQGEVPFRDAWDHKPPLIHFTYALGLLIAAGRFWGIWLLGTAALAGAGWLSYRVLRPAHGLAIAAAVTVIWMLNLADLIGESLDTELFTLPLVFGALLVLVRWRDEPEQGHWPFLLGVLGGLAFMYRQNHIAVVLAAFLTGAVLGGGWRGVGYLGRSLLRTAAGGVAAVAPMTMYFVVTGSWRAMWDAAFHYNLLYSWPGIAAQWQAAMVGIDRIPWTLVVLPVWLVLLVRLAARKPFPAGRRGVLVQAAMIALPLELYLSTLSGKHHAHYFALWLPSLALLLAEVLGWPLRSRAPSPGMGLAARVVVGAMVALVLGSLGFDRLRWRYTDAADPDDNPAIRWSVEYLRERTSPDQPVLMWGADAVILALAERRSSTRFFFQYALITPAYRPDAMAEEFLTEFERTPPVVIVDTGHRFLPSLDAVRRIPVELPDWPEARVYGPVSPRMEAFFAEVDRDYIPVASHEQMTVYRRRGDVPTGEMQE